MTSQLPKKLGRTGPDWQQIDTVRMVLKSAELRQSLVSQPRYFFLACDLVTIARGSCQITIREISAQSPDAPQNTVASKAGPIGNLSIPLEQSVMSAEINLSPKQFADVQNMLSQNGPRNMSLSLQLDGKLAVSIDGLLWVESQTTLPISDMLFQVSLK